MWRARAARSGGRGGDSSRREVGQGRRPEVRLPRWRHDGRAKRRPKGECGAWPGSRAGGRALRYGASTAVCVAARAALQRRTEGAPLRTRCGQHRARQAGREGPRKGGGCPGSEAGQRGPPAGVGTACRARHYARGGRPHTGQGGAPPPGRGAVRPRRRRGSLDRTARARRCAPASGRDGRGEGRECGCNRRAQAVMGVRRDAKAAASEE